MWDHGASEVASIARRGPILQVEVRFGKDSSLEYVVTYRRWAAYCVALGALLGTALIAGFFLMPGIRSDIAALDGGTTVFWDRWRSGESSGRGWGSQFTNLSPSGAWIESSRKSIANRLEQPDAAWRLLGASKNRLATG